MNSNFPKKIVNSKIKVPNQTTMFKSKTITSSQLDKPNNFINKPSLSNLAASKTTNLVKTINKKPIAPTSIPSKPLTTNNSSNRIVTQQNKPLNVKSNNLMTNVNKTTSTINKVQRKTTIPPKVISTNNTTLQRENDEMKKTIKNLKIDIKNKNELNSKAKLAIEGLACIINYLNLNLDAFDNPRLKEENSLLYKEKEDLNLKIKKLNEEIENLNQEITNQSDRFNKEKNNLIEMFTKEMKIVEEIEKNRTRCLEEDILSLREENNRLNVKLRESKEKELKTGNERINYLISEVSSLNSVIELKDIEIKKLNLKINKDVVQKDDLEALKQKNINLKQIQEQLELSLKLKTDMLNKLQHDHEELKTLFENENKERLNLSRRNEELKFVIDESINNSSFTFKTPMDKNTKNLYIPNSYYTFSHLNNDKNNNTDKLFYTQNKYRSSFDSHNPLSTDNILRINKRKKCLVDDFNQLKNQDSVDQSDNKNSFNDLLKNLSKNQDEEEDKKNDSPVNYSKNNFYLNKSLEENDSSNFSNFSESNKTVLEKNETNNFSFNNYSSSSSSKINFSFMNDHEETFETCISNKSLKNNSYSSSEKNSFNESIDKQNSDNRNCTPMSFISNDPIDLRKNVYSNQKKDKNSSSKMDNLNDNLINNYQTEVKTCKIINDESQFEMIPNVREMTNSNMKTSLNENLITVSILDSGFGDL